MSLPPSALREELPLVSVPNCGEGLSSGWPWGTGVSTLTWVTPAKVRIKPAGQAAQASDYTSLHIRLLSRDYCRHQAYLVQARHRGPGGWVTGCLSLPLLRCILPWGSLKTHQRLGRAVDNVAVVSVRFHYYLWNAYCIPGPELRLYSISLGPSRWRLGLS